MKPEDELTLPGLAGPSAQPISLVPAKGRERPAVWVSKLAVYKSWPPSPDTLLRQVIELRRGLNIIWARPTGATNEASRLAGHGAGKSTFCRLVRYVLGEDPAGTKAFRDGFRDRFENGWVLAEVFVGGQKWLVGRPLSQSGYHPFAKLNGSLADTFPDSPSNLGFKDGYLAAIDTAVFGNMRFRVLADSQKTLDWLRLLPWLSRDQEAHFSGLLEWRHKDSDHNSPDVSHEDKANLIRLILGLVDQEEQQLLSDYARKAELHEQKIRDRPKLEFAVERERQTLEATLKIKVESPDAPLLQQTVDLKVKQLRDESDQALASVKQNEEIDLLIAEVGRTRAEWGIANALIEDLEETIAIEDAKAKGSQPPPVKKDQEKDSYREALRGLGPFPGYCSHPMNRAWTEGCPIAQERPKEDEVTAATKQITQEVQPVLSKIETMKGELQKRRLIGAPKKQAWEAAVGKLTLARTRHQQELEKLKAPGRTAATIEALLSSYRGACNELVRWDQELTDLKKEKEELDQKLSELAKHHKTLVEGFSTIFNHIAQLMLGSAVSGTIRIKGKALVPELEYHGPRDSAALKVVRWLIFDLAALALGMTNLGAHHPRFLMHDSPREADLAAAIYVSLFTAALELEGTTGEEASFQYIVTTTEPPSDSLNQKPWVIDPILDASREQDRLLGIDL